MRDKCGRQGGDKCKLMQPKEPRVKDKGETSVNSCGPRHPECGRQVWETSVKSCGPRHPEWGQVRETRGDKCKLMRPKGPRVGDKCGRQVWETSVNSCGPRNPEWETSVGDKCGRQV